MKNLISECINCKSTLISKLNSKVPSINPKHGLAEYFDLYKCNKCGLFYKYPEPNEQQLNTYYNNIGTTNWNSEHQYPYESKVDSVLNKLPSKSKVLDVGCNTGRFVEKHANRLNCIGIEPNSEAAKVAELKGIQVFSEIDVLIESKLNNFNIIILLDVIEHLLHPVNLIDKLVDLLAINGKLIIVTGNTSSFIIRLIKGFYWYIRLSEHIVFF